jgi:acyl-coenzyme A thioesterase PaaI-like protein
MTEAQMQPVSKMCFVCGVENSHGLHLKFRIEANAVWVDFTPREEHQGWPGVAHGGIIAALLDEVMGRTSFLLDLWVVTGTMNIRYVRPVPVGQPLSIRAEITSTRSRAIETRAVLTLADGVIGAEATGTYIILPDAMRQELASRLQLVK